MNDETKAFGLARLEAGAPAPVLCGVRADGRLDGVLFDLTLRQTYRNTGDRVLALMAQQADRMHTLVSDLLTLAQLEGSPRPPPDRWVAVAGLLAHLGVKAPRVAVEINEAVVTKDRYDGHALQAGDAVEIVAFVGGG